MRFVDRLSAAVESASVLDAPAQALKSLTDRIGMGAAPVRDALSGTPLGHPLHPLMVTMPIGAWVSATVFDLFGKDEAAAQKLVGVGIISALPTMAAGLNDWRYTTGPEQRVGLAHAIGNSVALGLYGGSYLARRRGHHGLGVVLALTGSGALSASGWLGGHLSYALGVGVDTTAFLGGNDDWEAVGPRAQVASGAMVEKTVDGVSVLLSEVDGEVVAIANRCTHRGAPLNDGERNGDCVTCPWHQSVFDLKDGSVQTGPAQRPQPVYDVRVTDGQIEVKRHQQSGLQSNSVGV